LGLRSFADIPAFKELEEWFEAVQDKKSPREAWDLDPFFGKIAKLASRRRARELERRETVTRLSAAAGLRSEFLPRAKSDPDLFRSDAAAITVHRAQPPQGVMQSCSSQRSASRPGKKKL
jgi:hypothetical protein